MTTSLREVMGSNNAKDSNTGSSRVAILDDVKKRQSVALGHGKLREMVRYAPWMQSILDIEDGDVDSLANAATLWMQTHVVEVARKEVVKESEVFAQNALRDKESVISELRKETRALTGFGRPEDAMNTLEERIVALLACLEKEKKSNYRILAIERSVEDEQRNLYGGSGNNMVFLEDDNAIAKMERMNKMKRALIEGKEKEVSKYVKSITGIEEKDKKAKGLSPDFPSAALSMDVETFSSLFEMWLTHNLKDYYALAPYLLYIIHSYDVKEGCYGRAPEVTDIPDEIIDIYIENGESMCKIMRTKFKTETWDELIRTYSYGIDKQFHRQEMFLWGDAPRVLHCVLTMLNQKDIRSVGQIENDILMMPNKFRTTSPKSAVAVFQKLLKKAVRVNATVPFSIASELAVILSERNPSLFSSLVREYQTCPSHMPRGKCGPLLFEMLTEVEKLCEMKDTGNDARSQRAVRSIEVEEICDGGSVLAFEKGNKSYSYNKSSSQVGNRGQNNGGGKKGFPDCCAEKCNSKVCEARRSTVRPYPPHPSGLCIEHFLDLIRNKSITTKDGKFIVSKRDEEGNWKYSVSNSPATVETNNKKNYFINEIDMLTESILSGSPQDESLSWDNIPLEEIRMLYEFSSKTESKVVKRKREDSPLVERSCKFLSEIAENNDF